MKNDKDKIEKLEKEILNLRVNVSFLINHIVHNVSNNIVNDIFDITDYAHYPFNNEEREDINNTLEKIYKIQLIKDKWNEKNNTNNNNTFTYGL